MQTDPPHRVLIGFALGAVLAAGLVSAAAAQTPAPYVQVYVDGHRVAFDQPPAIGNGRVLVPLRGVFERLGATVSWDPASQTVLAKRGAANVSLKISSPQAFVNGQAQFLDVPAMLIGGRTLVPLRFVSRALGAVVAWDPATTTVQITRTRATAAPPARVPSAGTHAAGIAPTSNPFGSAAGVANGIDVAPAGAALAPISAVTISPTGRPLMTGDVMTVVATGPVHGAATFSIDGVRQGLPMREFISAPGTYIGTYAIQPGDNVTATNVEVSITAPTGQIETAAAPAQVSVSSPPRGRAGGAPVISSPAPGAGIRAPLTVTGTAPPGSLVQVRADYAGAGATPNLRGTLGMQTVTVDANGNWSVTFAARPPVRGTAVTISAVLVDATGAVRTPATAVNTTLQ